MASFNQGHGPLAVAGSEGASAAMERHDCGRLRRRRHHQRGIKADAVRARNGHRLNVDGGGLQIREEGQKRLHFLNAARTIVRLQAYR